ncbi:MAG: hypothetical protein WB615_16415 [Candidatus Tumulicola sp.]
MSAIAAVLLAIFALGALAPFPLRFAAPLYGELDFSTAPDGTVTKAGLATGLRPGDKIEWAKVPLGDRHGSVRRPMAGTTVVYPFLRDGVEHHARLRSSTIATDTRLADKIVVTAKVAAWIFFVLLALAIVLKRPSPMTWGFYIYALGNTEDSASGLSLLPTIPFHVVEFGAMLLSLVSGVGLMLFALRFPDDRVDGWRRTAQRAIPWLVIAYAALAAWYTYGIMTMTLDWTTASRLGLLAPLPPYVVAWIALIESYRRSAGANRLRLRWAIAGVFVGTLLPGLAIPLQGLTAGATFTQSESFAAFANIAIPLLMGYAIVRHRVINVEFILNRALVLGAVAGLLAGAFVLLDWLFTNYLTQTRWQIAVGVGVAFALGWSARSGRRMLIGTIDSVFFPKRHAVMRSMHELRIALETAPDQNSVNQFVVEGAQILQLDSAAIFARMPDGGFVREAAIGWSPGTAWHLLADDPIVARLEERARRPTRVTEEAWSDVRVPVGTGRPILAVPIGSARSAFALFGAHADGRDIDPDETRGLADLCLAAAAMRAA